MARQCYLCPRRRRNTKGVAVTVRKFIIDWDQSFCFPNLCVFLMQQKYSPNQTLEYNAIVILVRLGQCVKTTTPRGTVDQE